MGKSDPIDFNENATVLPVFLDNDENGNEMFLNTLYINYQRPLTVIYLPGAEETSNSTHHPLFREIAQTIGRKANHVFINYRGQKGSDGNFYNFTLDQAVNDVYEVLYEQIFKRHLITPSKIAFVTKCIGTSVAVAFNATVKEKERAVCLASLAPDLNLKNSHRYKFARFLTKAGKNKQVNTKNWQGFFQIKEQLYEEYKTMPERFPETPVEFVIETDECNLWEDVDGALGGQNMLALFGTDDSITPLPIQQPIPKNVRIERIKCDHDFGVIKKDDRYTGFDEKIANQFIDKISSFVLGYL